jgi:hypothetical protein
MTWDTLILSIRAAAETQVSYCEKAARTEAQAFECTRKGPGGSPPVLYSELSPLPLQATRLRAGREDT